MTVLRNNAKKHLNRQEGLINDRESKRQFSSSTRLPQGGRQPARRQPEATIKAEFSSQGPKRHGLRTAK
jgi:hypothetical protein